MDFRERIQRDPNPLQKLVNAIPGFSGYVDREQRRGADKMLREFLADEIDEAVERLERVASDWSDAGRIDMMDDLERVAGRLRRAGDNLRYADYGYSGFFDLVRINEEDLHRFYEYDLSLRSFIGDIQDDVDELADAQDEDESADMLAALDEDIDALAEMIDERENVATDLVP
ncbi:MAG: hypothetical protein ACP5KN_02640 [Armatimonadota bacterium]